MPEFTLELDDCAVVRSYVAELNNLLEDQTRPILMGSAVFNEKYLTVQVNLLAPVLTIYFGMLLLIAGIFSIILWSNWATLFVGIFFTVLSLMGSSYYLALRVLIKLWIRGYRGRVRLVHAEGVF